MNLGALQLRALFEHWPSARPLVTSPETNDSQGEREKSEERADKDGRSEREGEEGGGDDGVEEMEKRQEEGGVSDREMSDKPKSKNYMYGEALCV